MTNFDELVAHVDQPGIDRDPNLDIIRLRPDLTQSDALKLQLAVKRRRIEAGDRLVGYQASFTSAGIRTMFPDAPSPMVGSLLSSLIRKSGETVQIGEDVTFIESEVGVLLKHDLEGPDLTHAEILSAIEGFLPAIEVAPLRPGVKEGKYSWPHMIAVQKAPGGYVVLGDTLTAPQGFDIRLEGCVVTMDGRRSAGAVGLEAMGSPLTVVASIARKLHEVGEKLHKGQIVITGSLPPPQVIQPGDADALVEFQTLGRVSVRFER